MKTKLILSSTPRTNTYNAYDESWLHLSHPDKLCFKIKLFVKDSSGKLEIKDRFLAEKEKWVSPLKNSRPGSGKSTPKRAGGLLHEPISKILERIEKIEQKEAQIVESQTKNKKQPINAPIVNLKAKYRPQKFLDLLEYGELNRNLTKWLKSWDSIVFKKVYFI